MKFVKLGILTDVHANVFALKKCVEYLEKSGCDEVFNLGDTISLGANSKECLDIVLEKGFVNLLGNHDRDYLLNYPYAKPLSHTSTEHKFFVFEQLKNEYRNEIAKFPLEVEREYYGKKLQFCHYPVNHSLGKDEYPFQTFQPVPSVENFNEICKDYQADLIFFGHKHEKCLLHGDKIYCDVGSLGCHPRPFAEFKILKIFEDGTFKIQQISLAYNRKRVLEELLKNNVPSGQYIFDFYYDQIVF